MKQEMMGWQWHQLDHMEIICTLLQAPHHSIFTEWMLFLTPNQQCQSTEGRNLGEARLVKQELENIQCLGFHEGHPA